MRLSALDIKKKEFQQKMRGIDQDEVQSFLNQAADEVETLTREKKELEDRSKQAQQQLEHFLSLEQTLERTLVAAQQTALRIEEQAKKEAELIVRSAELERDRALSAIKADTAKINSDLFHLKAEYHSTLTKLQAIMQGFGEFLRRIEPEEVAVGAPTFTEPVATIAPRSEQSIGFTSDL